MPPIRYNTQPAYSALVRGRTHLVVVSDSRWSAETSDMRICHGMRNLWPIRWRGWTGKSRQSSATLLDGVSQATGTFTNTIDFKGHSGTTTWPFTGDPDGEESDWLFQPGSVGISPTYWYERQFITDATTTSDIWRSFLSNGTNASDLFGSFKHGKWNRESATDDHDVLCNLGYYWHNAAPSQTSFNLCTKRGAGAAACQLVTPTGSAGIKSVTRACNGTGEPTASVRLETSITDGTYNPSVAAAESSLAILGCHYTLSDDSGRAGVEFTNIANSGWTARGHASTTLCSAANLAGYCAWIGGSEIATKEWVLLIDLGQNLDSSTEITGGVVQAQFKTNLLAVANRWVTALVAAGATESLIRVVFVPPNRAVGWTMTQQGAIAQAHWELARDWSGDSSATFLNATEYCGDRSTNLTNGVFGTDGVHTSTILGAEHFARSIWELLAGNGGVGGRGRFPRRH